MLFLPELTLLGAGLILFIISLGQPGGAKIKNTATILTVLIFIASLLSLKSEGTLFYEAYKIDLFSQLFKAAIAFSTLILLIFSSKENDISGEARAEYYLFMFMSVLGLMMLVSSVELISIFVALELSSFAVYIMVPLRKPETGMGTQIEAGIKYLLFGVMATGLMLFGMSYIYGLTGSTSLPEITEKLATLYTQPAALIAILLVLAGFFYKLALFPLHFWVPDVYQGAANETAAFIAAVPKLAAVALLIRIVNLVSGEGQVIVNVLMVCALLSMFYGNLSALVQKDVKRLLGFSGIAHAGFVLVGLLTFSHDGFAVAIYYIAGYAIMILATFLVICSVSPSGQNLSVDDFTGLHKREPIMAITLTISLFALAGIPPFVGFTGKFLLLLGALKQGHLTLVVLAAINTAIAIYYYLSIVRLTFCTDSEERATFTIKTGSKALAMFLMLCIIIMGIAPKPFISLANSAVQAVM